jgi:predicted lipid-binding transport protein (Tim44 family)
MRYLILTLMIIFISLGSIISTADAARFGGGKSFGMSRSYSANRSYNMGNAAQRQTPTGNRWLGPLAGLAMGGLLASLFMGHGIGAGMMSWLLVGGAIFLIWRLFSGLQRSSRFQAQSPMNNQSASFRTIEGNLATSAPNNQYSQFEEQAFLRQAKSTFIRLQAAYDNKDLTDIRTYTSPEIFAEIQLQLQERGDTVNHTEVVNIDAELADLDIQSESIVASVTFSGQLREERNGPIVQIKETWHFQQLKNSTQWTVAGIQQA